MSERAGITEFSDIVRLRDEEATVELRPLWATNDTFTSSLESD